MPQIPIQTHGLKQKGSIHMVWNIVKDMFDSTDSTGTLIIKGWNTEAEGTESNPRFYKCRMDWDFNKAQQIADDAAYYCEALEEIGEFLADVEKDIYCASYFGESSDDSYTAQLNEVWELFLCGCDGDTDDVEALTKLAEERLGRELNACSVFERARRIVNVSRLGAPDVILDNEKYEFVRAYVLNQACGEMVCADLSKDSFDEKTVTLGGFNEDDINCIFEMLFKDCSVMPEERIGYTLLVNMIFGDIRLDLYRNYDRIKPAVDAALATLSKTEREVLEKLCGLTGGVRRTHAAAALEMHIPLPMIQEYEGSALRKLRHPCRLKIVDNTINR